MKTIDISYETQQTILKIIDGIFWFMIGFLLVMAL